MPLAMRGETGAIKWAWHSAATLGPWTLEGRGDSFFLSAHITDSNAFRVSQRPLVFEHHLNGKVMTWQVAELQVTGETLTASLMP